MLLVLKRTISMRGYFEYPKYMFKLMDKKKITILHLLLSMLNWTYVDAWYRKSIQEGDSSIDEMYNMSRDM